MMAHLHRIGCDCPRCSQPHPADRDNRVVWIIAGVVVGLALCKLIDVSIGGPGLLAAFGF